MSKRPIRDKILGAKDEEEEGIDHLKNAIIRAMKGILTAVKKNYKVKLDITCKIVGMGTILSYEFLKNEFEADEAEETEPSRRIVELLENRIEKEIREIQRYGVDLNNLKKEAFTIISAYQWYLEEGKAQGETIIANWLTLVKEKEKAGFTGLRVAGEMEVFVDYMETAELMKYEELLGRQLNFNMCGLCLYDRDIFDEDQFTQAYKSHSHLISKGIAGRTPQ